MTKVETAVNFYLPDELKWDFIFLTIKCCTDRRAGGN